MLDQATDIFDTTSPIEGTGQLETKIFPKAKEGKEDIKFYILCVHAQHLPGWKFRSYSKHERPCLTTFPNTENRVESTTPQRSTFDELRGVWKCGETLS